MSHLKCGERYFTNRDHLSQVWLGIRDLAKITASDLSETCDNVALEKELHAPFSCMVCGEVNSGKSSLINTLFDHDLCPVNSLPETQQIIRYRHDEAIRDAPSSLCREVFLPAPILRDFNPIDTPGTNALNAEQKQNIERLFPVSEVILFVFPASNPWSASTWNMIGNLPAASHERMAFVIQQCDSLEPVDIAVILEHMADLSMKRIGMVPSIFPVSAKLAFEAKRNEALNRKLYQESGFPALENFLSERICYSHKRKTALKTWHDQAGSALYLIDNQIDHNTRLQRNHHQFLRSLEDEIDAMRESLVSRLPSHLTEVAEIFQNEAILVTRKLRRWLSVARSFFKVFTGDSTGIRTEALLTERLRSAVESVAENDGKDIVTACLKHWQDLGTRINESIGLPIEQSLPIDEALENARKHFVERIGSAAHQAIENLHVRKDLERELRYRNRALKSFTASALILLSFGAISGIMNAPLLPWILCGVALLFLLGGTIIAIITKSRITHDFRVTLLDTCGAFADALRSDYEDALRSFFQEYTSCLSSIKKHLAQEERSNEPKQNRWKNLFLTLKSIEQDL
ncbi:MAG: dynamin family protein [Verrucomicrobiota bacterium]